MKTDARALAQPVQSHNSATVIPLQVTPKAAARPARLRPLLQRAIPPPVACY